MRLLLKLQFEGKPSLPVNYFYPLSAAIYNMLKFGSPEFSEFLHDTGYKLNGKSYKNFTFALRVNKPIFNGSRMIVSDGKASLIISSPLVDEFIQNFVIGTFETQHIEIAGYAIKSVMRISQVEILPQPEFQPEMKFSCLSPIVISTTYKNQSKKIPKYLRHTDSIEEINRILNKNILNKYYTLYGELPIEKSIRFEWDKKFIELSEARNKKITRKQTIKEGTPQQTDIIGNMAPFKISGDTELIKTGYECGFGEKNSMGFGMAKTDFSNLKL